MGCSGPTGTTPVVSLMTRSISRISLPSSRYVRNEESDQAGSDVLSDETGGDVSISFDGTGAGREGGGIEAVGERVGEEASAARVLDRSPFGGVVVEGLSSGVGVDTGEGVSWLEVSAVRPGGWCESGSWSLF